MFIQITVVPQRERERKSSEAEGPVCLPRLLLTFIQVVLDDVTVDDSGACQCRGASVWVYLV